MVQSPPPVRDEDFPEPPRLRRLRLMVSALILVLIAAVVIVVASLVINLGALTGRGAPAPVTAESIALPEGETVTALGESRDSLLLTTRATDGTERVRAFDRRTGEPLSMTLIERTP